MELESDEEERQAAGEEGDRGTSSSLFIYFNNFIETCRFERAHVK